MARVAESSPPARPALATRAGGPRPPVALLGLGLVVAILAVLPLAYLVIRAAGAEADALAFLARPRTVQVLLNTVALALVVGVATTLLGLPIAILTTRTDLPGRSLWAIVTIVPLAIPSYVTGFAFVAAFGPRGMLQGLLEPIGIERLPSIYGFPGAALVLVLATYPYVVLSTRATLLHSDPAMDEGARSLGDGPLTGFRRVGLPILAPAIAAGALLAVLYSLSDFGAVSLLQFDSFSRAIYVQYRASFDRNLAALLSLLLVAVTLGVMWGETRIRRRASYAAGVAPRRPPIPIRLGSWRLPALVFCLVVTAFALVVPAGTIAFWLVRGLAQGASLQVAWDAAARSLLAGAASALGATALALPIAFLVVRYPGRLTELVGRSTYAAYALPGIVIALAVVFFAANVIPRLYQTLPLLVLAFAIRFLPLSLGTIRASLLGIGPRLSEAGRSLGRTPAEVFRTVTLPLLRPAVVAGAALVFLTTVKELPMTLLLAPTGFDTLATEIWSATSEGFYASAAIPAAILLALSAATVALLLRGEEAVR